jgi:EAP30/Vps36 family
MNTDDDDGRMVWTPFDCMMGASLTASGLLQRSRPTEVEVYTTLLPTVRPPCVELRSTYRSASSNGEQQQSEPMVPLTASGTIDTAKPMSNYRDRTTFPFQIIVTTHRIVFVRDSVRSDTTWAATGITTTATTSTTANHIDNNHNHSSSSSREARYLHLSNVFSMTTESHYFKSPKIILSTSIGELIIAFMKHNSAAHTVNPTKIRDDCYSHFMNSYQMQQWDLDDAHALQKDAQRKMVTGRKVGVDAIVSASQQRHAYATQITNRAFDHHPTTTTTGTTMTATTTNTGRNKNSNKDDLDIFLQEATELVQIIHKYVATLDRSVETSSSSNNNDSNSGNESDQLVNMLQDMGMTSILNKADYSQPKSRFGRTAATTTSTTASTSLDVYYDTMARQIVDLIRPKLQQQKVPIITLTDVYCWYNRSRGTHLISPDDLLHAVERLSYLNLGLSYITFPNSGLKALQDTSRTNPSALTETFLNMCQEQQSTSLTTTNTSGNSGGGGYITVLSVSQHCNISTILAMEQLQMIEQTQAIVRDETMEVIRFYPNLYFT